jgi:hypothetical protein
MRPWTGLLTATLIALALHGALADDVVVTSLESAQGWSAVGRAKVEEDADGWREKCLKITFGIPGEKTYMIVQGPTPDAAVAWEGRGEGVPNAFVFQASADQSLTLVVNLRVRRRGVAGSEGVVGVARAQAALSKGGWRRVVVPFAEFEPDRSLQQPVGPELFETYHPQIQFSMTDTSGDARQRVVRIDEIVVKAISPETMAAR